MKKKYLEPEMEKMVFSFGSLMTMGYMGSSDPEDSIAVWDGGNPNDPNEPDPTPTY